MSITSRHYPPIDLFYPDSDGEPIAENTVQFEWIATIKGGLDALFAGDPNVFVAGDLLWYPVEGDNRTRTAPDAMVAIGRPKGDRGSYMQWVEGDIPPQVVFEVLSPGNRAGKMREKFDFYDRFGVEEYYIYDPDDGTLDGWLRGEGRLQPIDAMLGWVSPRLGVTFGLDGDKLVLAYPDGSRFASYMDLFRDRDRATQQADAERERAEAERERADAERERAEALVAQLRALGIEPQA